MAKEKHAAPKVIAEFLREAIGGTGERVKIGDLEAARTGTRISIDETVGGVRVRGRLWVGAGRRRPRK